MAKTQTLTGAQVLEARKKAGLNQSQFWSRIGVTQSGGSRYESGRNIPAPTQTLLKLAYLSTDAKATAMLAELRAS